MFAKNSVFKQQSNDKKFIIEVCCFLCELQLFPL